LRGASPEGYNVVAMTSNAEDAQQRERARQLERQVGESWEEIDSEASVQVRLRPDGKFDLRLVSTRFEGMDSTEREALFWSRIRRLPSSITIRMTYALLLTPEEARSYFDEAGD
jgi:hypothetical protein